MDRDAATRLIQTYIERWKAANRAQVLSTLAPDCVVVECYGPVYRGIEHVGEWMDAWFGEAGNTVDRWEIVSLLVGDDGAAVEWRFACTWHGQPSAFEGGSIVRFKDGRIGYLREYATTGSLYD